MSTSAPRKRSLRPASPLRTATVAPAHTYRRDGRFSARELLHLLSIGASLGNGGARPEEVQRELAQLAKERA